MLRLLALSLLILSCYTAEAPVSTLAVTTTPLNVYPYTDAVSGKRFLVFVLNGPNGQQMFQVVDATKPLPPPAQIPVYLAPLFSASPVPVAPQQKKIDPTNLNVEATEVIEKSQTHGAVPAGWKQYGTDPQTGQKLIERIKQLK